MRKLLALVLIASMPIAGVAQSLAPAPSNPIIDAQLHPLLLEQMLGQGNNPLGAAEANSVPLWSTPDGRVLAMVASDGSAYPTLPKSPLIGASMEWRLVDVTNIVSSGLLMRLGDSATAHVSLSQSVVMAPTYAPLLQCGQATGTDNSCTNANTLARGGEWSLGANWLAADNLDLDLSYGLSWLRHDNSTLAERQSLGYDVLSGIGNAALPTLIIPGLELADVQNSSVSALGRLRLNDAHTLDLGATLSRIQLSIPGNNTPLTSLNQAALSVGVEYGSFTGMLTGRMLGPADSFGINSNTGSRWTGLDVGFSWRTPWRGMFSVGAQNLWSSGSVPYLAEPSAREIDANQARVPYVQYHQDL